MVHIRIYLDFTYSYFVSFDIVSLFTNIPVDETINIIQATFPPNSELSAQDQIFAGMTKLIFLRSLEWS